MLYTFIASFAVGVAAGTLGADIPFASLCALVAGALFAYVRFVGKADARLHIVPVAFLSLALGIVRADLVPGPLRGLDAHVGRKVELLGTVVGEPDVRDAYARIIIDVREVAFGAATSTTAAKVLASVERHPAAAYGDEVRVSGTVALPEPFETEAGRTFDYPAFLAKDGIGYELKFGRAEIVARGNGNPVKRALFAFKRTAVSSFESIIPEPQSELLAGILLGVKGSLGEATTDDFKIAGIMHIVVLSGYNIAIVANAAVGALSRFGMKARLLGGSAAIVLFATMTGGTASIVRASLMAVLVLVARANGRTYLALRALFVVAFLMVMHRPAILLHDPGFQLSFIATFGLITLSPFIEHRLAFVTPKWGVRETAVSTLSAQLFVLPMVLYMTGELSIAALPANLLVLPAVPHAMAAGAVTSAFGFVSPHLAFLPGVAAYAFLSYILIVADVAAKAPFSSVPVPQLPSWSVALWYAAYGWAIWRIWVGANGREKENAARPREWDVSGAYEIVD